MQPTQIPAIPLLPTVTAGCAIGSRAPASLEAAIETVTSADGPIAVTPVFSASYSGLFKSFLDVIGNGALTGEPVPAAATGGTTRHSLALEHALRPLFAHLRAGRRTDRGVRGLRGLGRQRRSAH